MSDMQPVLMPDAAPGLTQLQRVTSIFSAPTKTFIEIRDGKRSWWLPFVIMAVFGYILFAVVVAKVGMQQVVDNQMHLNPAQEERLAQATPEQRALSQKISLIATEVAFIANPALVLAGIALLSLGLMATINFGFGGKAKFGSVFAMWMYAGLPGLVKVILGILVLFAGTAPESFNIKNYAPTNIGAFLNPADTNKVLYALASSLDVVTIWSMIVLGIGIATVAGVKRGSGYIAVFGWWFLFVLVGVGIAAVTG
jgi:hypothetical protein